MSRLQDSKNAYQNIPIPDRLNQVVAAAIAQSAESAGTKQATPAKPEKRRRSHIAVYIGRMAATAAVLAVLLAVGVNTSPVLAQGLENVPVIGALVKLFTIQSYQAEDDTSGITVETPAIEFIQEDTGGLADDVNARIKAECDAYAAEARTRAEEYRKAFMETGGTEEEWKAHNIQIKVWYELKSQSDSYLSFVVSGTENWTSAYAQSRYYNLDLKNMKYVSLRDLLGEDYISIANESIRSQIAALEASGSTFFTESEGGFETITDGASFYINEKGNPVIVFEKYEIAPGSMGNPEFEITARE